MEVQLPQVRVFGLDQFNYPKFRGEIIDLYLNAFTTGEYAQYIPMETAESTLDESFRTGFGNMAFVDERLAGVLIALPLLHDKEFSKEKCPEIPIEKAVYIAEVMVHTNYRGKGIASQLIENLLEQASDVYVYAVIRVWDENKPALSLYEKIGFKPSGAEIVQTKMRNEDETFEMKKIYLVKRIR